MNAELTNIMLDFKKEEIVLGLDFKLYTQWFNRCLLIQYHKALVFYPYLSMLTIEHVYQNGLLWTLLCDH